MQPDPLIFSFVSFLRRGGGKEKGEEDLTTSSSGNLSQNGYGDDRSYNI